MTKNFEPAGWESYEVLLKRFELFGGILLAFIKVLSTNLPTDQAFLKNKVRLGELIGLCLSYKRHVRRVQTCYPMESFMYRYLHYFTIHTFLFCKLLGRHWPWLLLLPLTMMSIVSVNLLSGSVIPKAEWVWLDIIGEGGLALFMVVWMLIVLATREPGFITNWLAFGFLGLCASSFQDMLDEVIVLAPAVLWDKWIESAPIGLLALVVGLCLWFREQRQISAFLAKRATTLQNNFSLQQDSFLPQWSCLSKQVQDNSNQAATLVLLRIAPESRNQLPLAASDLSKLRFLIAEILLWNVPDTIKAFHLTGESYALLSPTPVSQEQINDVVLLLRGMRFCGQGHVQATLLEVTSQTVILESSVSDAELRQRVQTIQSELAHLSDGIDSRQSIATVHVV